MKSKKWKKDWKRQKKKKANKEWNKNRVKIWRQKVNKHARKVRKMLMKYFFIVYSPQKG